MKALIAWVAGVLVILVVAGWTLLDPPPAGITPEDIRQMSATEGRVLGNCQLQKLGEDPLLRDIEAYILETDERVQQTGQPLEYIWYKDGYWCDKQERHDFWTRPQYD